MEKYHIEWPPNDVFFKLITWMSRSSYKIGFILCEVFIYIGVKCGLDVFECRRVWIVLLMKCSVQTSSDCPPVCFRWAGFCCLTGRSRFMPEKVLFRSAATKSWSSTNSRQTFSVTGEERSLRDEAAHLSKCFFKLHLDFHPPVMHCSPSAPFLSAKHHTVHTTQIKYASETALYGTLTMHFWFVCEVEQALWDQDGSFSIWRVYTHSRFTVFLHRAASACFLRSKDASSDLYSLRYWICYSCRCT